MRKQTSILLAFLLSFSVSWASAEEISVKVAGDRTAVVQVQGSESANGDATGTIKGSINLQEGKSAFQGDLVANDPQLEGAKAGFYTNMTGTMLEAIGFVDMSVPQEPDAPKVFDVAGRTVTDGDVSTANMTLKMEGPSQGGQIPSGTGEATFEGDFKSMRSNGKFDLSGGDVKAEELPFKSLNFEIVEADQKTTISFEVVVPSDSQEAKNLDMLPAMAPKIEENLKNANVQYENIEFPAPTEKDGMKTGTGTLTVIDIRGTIKPFLGFGAQSLQRELGPDVDVKGAMEKMLEVKLDKFAFSIAGEGEAVNGTFDVNVSNIDKFYEGYVVLMPALQKQQNQQLAYQMGEAGPLFSALMEMNSKQAIGAIKALIASDMKYNGDMKFNLSPKGTEEEQQNFELDASANFNATGYQSYVEQAKAQNVPVADKMVGDFKLNLADGSKLVGDLYFYTDGDFVTYYKGMMASAAEESGAPQDVVDSLKSVEFNSGTMQMKLDGKNITLQGNGDTSDLTPVVKSVLQKAAPQIQATLTGATFDINMPETGEGSMDVKAYFNEFMPGKNEAQIKEALGLPSSATVAVEAPADEVKFVAVEVPEITVDGKLAEVQDAGKQLLASGPEAVADGAGGGGGNNWGLLALGAILLVGVGGFLMFGKK